MCHLHSVGGALERTMIRIVTPLFNSGNYSLKYLKQNTEFLSGHTETPASHQLTYTTTVKLIITYHALFLKMSLHTLPPQPIVSHVQSDPEIFMSHQSWICLSSCCCVNRCYYVILLDVTLCPFYSFYS